MKPGDKVFYVSSYAAQYPYIHSIRAAIFIQEVGVGTRWPRLQIHLGGLGTEDVEHKCVFATFDEALAGLQAAIKKRIPKLRAEVRRLKAFVPAKVKLGDRTSSIRPHRLQEILAKAGGAAR